VTNKKIEEKRRELSALEEPIRTTKTEQSKTRSVTEGRQREIDALRQSVNATEDTVFRDFCRKVEVSNIREYEETQLKQSRELIDKKTTLHRQLNKLKSQLEHERSRDLAADKSRLQASVTEDDRLLKELQKRQQSLSKTLETSKREVDALFESKQKLVAQSDDRSIELKQLQKELEALREQQRKSYMRWVTLDAQIGQLKSRRHDLLENAKRRDITLPRVGQQSEDQMEVEEEEVEEPSSSSSQFSQQFTADDDLVKAIDFSSVKKLQAKDESQYEAINNEMENDIRECVAEMEKLAPNRKAPQKFQESAAKLEDQNRAHAEVRKSKDEIDSRFNKVKEKR
jgi:structural maintenance of chromosome 1